MDPLIHLIVPILILFVLGINAKKVLFLSPFAILMDFDVFLEPHRAVLHNFILCLVMPMIFIVYCYLKKKDWMIYGLIIQFYLLSHILMDLDEGIAFLYPITEKAGYFLIQIDISFNGLIPDFQLELNYGIMSSPPEFERVPFVSNLAVAIIFVIILAIIYFLPNVKKLWKNIFKTRTK